MAAVDLDKITNVEDEVLWKRVREAFRMITNQHEREIELEINTAKILIYWATDDESNSGYAVIEIHEIEPKRPALLVP